MGDGMGGGRNGLVWGRPDFDFVVEKHCTFQGFGQSRGARKTALPTTAHPIPCLKPSEKFFFVLLIL